MDIDAVYRERDQLVAALSKIYPSHLAWHEDDDWEDGWRNIVCIHLPTGQAAWHISNDEIVLFDHLHQQKDHWDGHTTDEKYDRLGALHNISKYLFHVANEITGLSYL
jgi:hypothetical protein